MEEMLVAELIAPKEFRLAQMQVEPPGPGEVQVRPDAVGICGSDLHNYAEGAIGDSPCTFPMVLGHEPSGTVMAVGAGVSGWAPGDRAALEPALYCYECEFCRKGQYNVCANIRFLSNPGQPGFFRERVNLPAKNLLPIPPSLPLDVATLHEPLAVALHSLKFAAVGESDTVAVIGAGPIGLLTIASLKLARPKRIWAVEPLAHRREMALQLGADAAIDPGQVNVAAEIVRETGGRGVDCAIDCAARQQTINDAIRACRNAGRVVLTGIHSECFVPFEVSPMRRKELAIFNVRRSCDEGHAAVELLVEQTARFAPMITHTRPLSQIAAAFRMAESYEDGAVKTVIRTE
jgi:L-iditol 2-dehydrogenase